MHRSARKALRLRLLEDLHGRSGPAGEDGAKYGRCVEILSVRSLVHATMGAFVKVYRRRPAFVQIYLRGRTNAAVHRFGREHNTRIAESLFDYAVDAGLARNELTLEVAQLAVEVGDRVFQLAYETEDAGDQRLVEEGMTMMTAYLERYATPEGLEGIRL